MWTTKLWSLWLSGRQWWLTPQEKKRMRELNMHFAERDEVFDLLATSIKWSNYERDIELGRVEKMTATSILVDRCGLAPSSITKRQANLCSEYLREITGRDADFERLGSSVGRFWLVPKKE